jgi:hypothetical protein
MYMNSDSAHYLPSFNFDVPEGYRWLFDKGVFRFEQDGLEPWFYLDTSNAFDATQRWPQGPYAGQLLAFARRYDTDDIACFAVVNGSAARIVLIHGWTHEGYSVVHEYETFWDWVKAVIDDIAFIL